nr:hypothetical protein [Gammaproteobacteria bacterium]
MAVLLIGSVGGGLFALGRASVNGGSTLSESVLCTNGDDQLALLRKDNALLREQTIMLERKGQVERAAYKRIGESLKQLQDEVLRLTEDLAVYKGIVVRADFRKSLVIQSVRLLSEEKPGLYRYHVVLTHFGAGEEVISGSMEIRVSGTQGGKASVLSLNELAGAKQGSPEIHLQFRHFVRVEGLLHLPQNFAPRYIRVRVHAKAQQQQTVEKTFTWKQATS